MGNISCHFLVIPGQNWYVWLLNIGINTCIFLIYYITLKFIGILFVLESQKLKGIFKIGRKKSMNYKRSFVYLINLTISILKQFGFQMSL